MNAIKQSQTYNRMHRIPEGEPIEHGFFDAGRGVPIDDEGILLAQPRRELIYVESPDTDLVLREAIDTATAATANMSELEAIDYLNDYVGDLLKVNNEAENRKLLEEMIAKHSPASADGNMVCVGISLGQMIAARTGVCRHRSLLFKVLADQLGIRAALVRGNYLRRRVDKADGEEGISGGHAWNEVVLQNSERILVDVMHNFVAELTDPVLANYAEIDGAPIYGDSQAGPLDPLLPCGDESRGRQDLVLLRAVPWVSVKSPQGGRSAYAYLDTMTESERRSLRRILKRQRLRYEKYRTSCQADGEKRPVLRVRGASHLALRRILAVGEIAATQSARS